MEKFLKLQDKSDFTSNVELSGVWKKRYAILRIALFCMAFLAALYIAFQVLFPSRSFDFFFRSAGALKNTVIDPRDEKNNPIENGLVKENANLLFDTAFSGDFSEIDINLILEKNSPPIQNAAITVRKSFQAFFYPISDPIGFKNGSLIKNGNKYLIVSDGKLREYSSLQLAEKLGYTDKSFIAVSEAELKYNEIGEEITGSSKVPNGTLFRAGDIFYQLKNQKMLRFVSEKAFLTQYDYGQAIEKNEEFLENFEISEELIGFSDGTLVSYGPSAYVISNNKRLPINNETTFVSMGFLWDDIIPADGEEIEMHEKEKLFNIAQPHPNGTIFLESDSDKYFLINNQEKREIIGSNILQSYLRKSPIVADKSGLETAETCELRKNMGFSKSYSCKIRIENFSGIPGNDYQFRLESDSGTVIKEIHATFKKNVNSSNLIFSLGDIKSKIKLNYGIQE